ncbi:MAG TPA: biotin/lipoyl-binding protein, partial [Dehalococcoidales bacterium]
MRVFKVIMAILIAGIIAVPVASCASKSNTASENQVATVQRGNLTIDIAASGNLALSRTADLAFDMAGTVQEVLVKEGDSITQGQVLASLDTSDWDKQLKTLQKQLVTAQRNLTSAERQIGAKELAVRQAELNLRTAEDNVKQIADVKAVQDQIEAAEQSLKTAQMMLVQGGGSLGTFYWSSLIVTIQENLAQLRQNLKGILSGTSLSVSSDVALQVAKSQLQVEQSQRALEDARLAVEDAQLAKEDAEQAVEDAQSALDEEKSLSPIIKATFAGFVTEVNVKGGDEV